MFTSSLVPSTVLRAKVSSYHAFGSQHVAAGLGRSQPPTLLPCNDKTYVYDAPPPLPPPQTAAARAASPWSKLSPGGRSSYRGNPNGSQYRRGDGNNDEARQQLQHPTARSRGTARSRARRCPQRMSHMMRNGGRDDTRGSARRHLYDRVVQELETIRPRTSEASRRFDPPAQISALRRRSQMTSTTAATATTHGSNNVGGGASWCSSVGGGGGGSQVSASSSVWSNLSSEYLPLSESVRMSPMHVRVVQSPCKLTRITHPTLDNDVCPRSSVPLTDTLVLEFLLRGGHYSYYVLTSYVYGCTSPRHTR